MHAMYKCIGWSETFVLHNRTLLKQVSTFAKICIHRHGILKKILVDREYFKCAFSTFCREHDIELIELAAGEYEENDIVERANRTLASIVVYVPRRKKQTFFRACCFC